MRQSLSAFIGLRFLLAKSKNRFISFISMSSMLGIAVGIMVLTIILSAMNGFERELTQRLLSVVPHAEMSAVKPSMLNWRQQIEQATDHRKVEAGAPYIKLNALIMQGADLKGLDANSAKSAKSAESVESESAVFALFRLFALFAL